MKTIKIVIPTNTIVLTQQKLNACTKNILYSLEDIDISEYSIDLVYIHTNSFETVENFYQNLDFYVQQNTTYEAVYGTQFRELEESIILFSKNYNNNYDISNYDFFNSIKIKIITEEICKRRNEELKSGRTFPGIPYSWDYIAYNLYEDIKESLDTDIYIFTTSNYFMWKKNHLKDAILRYENYNKLPIYFSWNRWSIPESLNHGINTSTDISHLTDESYLNIRTVAMRQFLCRPKHLVDFTKKEIFNGNTYSIWNDTTKVEYFNWNYYECEGKSHKTDSLKIKQLKNRPPLEFIRQTDINFFHIFESWMVTEGYKRYNIPIVDFGSIKLPLSQVDNIDEDEWDFGVKFDCVHEVYKYLLGFAQYSIGKNYLNNDEVYLNIIDMYDKLSVENINIKRQLLDLKFKYDTPEINKKLKENIKELYDDIVIEN